jgi:IMP dehydrogenase
MATFTHNGVTVSEEELLNGYSANEIFDGRQKQGITFDDVICLPGMIDFGVHEVDLRTKVTRNISLSVPFCSSPMDTVTGDRMAIGMALNGGIGFIHCACGIDEQVQMVKTVKGYENGFIVSPAVLSPRHLVSDLDTLQEENNISGVPITVDGKMRSRLIGIVSNRDTDFLENRQMPLENVMTPVSDMVIGRQGITITEANRLLKESKKGYLPIVDEHENLCALTTRTDLKKNRDFPLSSKGPDGKLLVGAAVHASIYDEIDFIRIDALINAGCDVILLESSNGDNITQLNALKSIKSKYPNIDVIAGNIVRPKQAKELIAAGADGLRVGMGVGSVATTQLVTAVGRGQISAIYYCAKLAKSYGIPIIADGGIKSTGCIIKALMVGASAVMMGSLLAGADESPGDFFFQDELRLKNYRGNISLTSIQASSIPTSPKRNRTTSFSTKATDEQPKHRVASGVSGAVVDKGPLNRYIPYLSQSVRHGLQDMGTVSLTVLWESLYNEKLRFELRSPSAQREGGIHDLHSFSQTYFA